MATRTTDDQPAEDDVLLAEAHLDLDLMFSSSPSPARATYRLLVVANETAGAGALAAAIAGFDPATTEVLVVAPALTGRLRFWADDDWAARSFARERLHACLDTLAVRGHDANGQVGDADPLLAIEDALAVFPADEILLVTHPPGASNWLERRLVERTIERFGRTVAHLVVEPVAPAGRRPPARLVPVAA